MGVFFDKNSSTSGYDKLLQEEGKKARRTRIANADHALEELKLEIDARQKKLNDVLSFLDNERIRYQELNAQYEQSPSATLAEQIKTLKQTIDALDKKLEETQPEKALAALTTRYEELCAILEEKKAKSK